MKKKTPEGKKPQEVKPKVVTLEQAIKSVEEPVEKVTPVEEVKPPVALPTVPPPVSSEKYYMIEWAVSSNPMEPARVKITVNGETLTWKRGVETAAPGRYLEAARNTTHEIFEQNPDDYDQKEGYRKTVRVITRFPYSVRREITKEEYMKLKAVGDKENKDYLKNHGLVRA